MGALFWVRLNADVNWDGVVFISAAKKYTYNGFREGFSSWAKFPIYPLLISFVQKFVSNWVVAGRMISFFATILIVAGLYLVINDLFGRRTALLGSLSFSLLPETLLQSISIYRDPCFLAAFTWSLFYCQKALKTKRLNHFLFGLLLIFFSAMFRVEGLVILPVYACILAISGFRDAENRKVNLIYLSLCVLLPVCLIAFYFLLIKFYPSSLTYANELESTFTSYLNPKIFENYSRISNQLQEINDSTPNSIVGVHFGIVAKRIIPLIFFIGILYMLSITMLFANSFAFLIGVRQSSWNFVQLFIFGSAAAYLCVLYTYFVWYDLMLKRWLLPVTVMACPWIGLGIKSILAHLKQWPHPRILSACLLILLCINAGSEFDKLFKKNDDLATIAGHWISRQNVFTITNTVFNDPVVAFYAGMEPAFSNQEDNLLYLDADDNRFTKIEHFAIERNADFIVIYVRTNHVSSIVPFKNFLKTKEFEKENRMVVIYCSENMYSRVTKLIMMLEE